MKKISILIMFILVFAACQKEELPNSGQESSEEETPAVACCDTATFVYHQRVEPADFTFGNVEYWECPVCGKCYDNSVGGNDITNSVYLFPTQFKTVNAALADNPYYSGSGENVAIATVFTVITILYSLYSIPTSICRSKLIDYANLNRQLDEIYSKVDGISSQLNDLAKAIRVIPDQKMILERSEDLASLGVVTEMARVSVDSVKKMYPTASKSDSVKLMDELQKIYKDWGGFEVGRQHSRPYELTEYLLANYFNPISGDYHKMYRNFVNSLCTWEHEGYPMRKAAMAQDLTIMTMSYCFTRSYYQTVGSFTTEESRKVAIKNLDDLYNRYVTSSKTDYDRDSVINVKYRVLLKTPPSSGASEVTYEKVITGPYNFYSQFKDHSGDLYFDYDNDGNRGVNSCNKLIDYMSKSQGFRCNDLMTQDEARLIVQIYNTTKHDKATFANILIDDCKFESKNNTDFKASTAHVIPERNNGHQKPRSESSSYKIFEWTAYRTGSDDHVGVYAVGAWDNNVQTYFKFAKDCRIARSDGKIKETGNDTGDRFYTVRRVKTAY